MTGITLSTDTYKEKPLIFRKSSVTVFPFFSRIHVYHNLLICDTSTFDNSAEYTFFIAEEIRVNFYFVVDLSLDESFFFFFDRRCKFVLSLSFVFFFLLLLFSFRHFREDTRSSGSSSKMEDHGERKFLGSRKS